MAIESNINNSKTYPHLDEGTSLGLNLNSETLNNSAILLINFAEAEIEKKYKRVIIELKKQVEEKDIQNAELIKRNEELEANIKKLQNSGSLTPVEHKKSKYGYDSVVFPKDSGDVIIDCVLELTKIKREHGKYVIKSKTDWYIVAKVLHYFKVFIGNEMDFLHNILSNVIENIEDPERKKKLEAKENNFLTIPENSPMKAIPVDKWRKEALKERERMEEKKLNGDSRANAETVLNRCVNIKEKLCSILINHDVQLDNY